MCANLKSGVAHRHFDLLPRKERPQIALQIVQPQMIGIDAVVHVHHHGIDDLQSLMVASSIVAWVRLSRMRLRGVYMVW
jgi:hypothetical protein